MARNINIGLGYTLYLHLEECTVVRSYYMCASVLIFVFVDKYLTILDNI